MSTLSTRKIIAGVLVVLSVFILFFLLFHFRKEIILIFTGIVISISISPVVDWLHQHKLPRSYSVILIYFGLVIIFLGFILLVIPQTMQQLSALVPRFERIYNDLKSTLESSPYPFIRQWIGILPASLNPISLPSLPGTGDADLNSFNLTLNIILSILEGLFTISIVLLLSFYWTLEGERLEYAFSLLLPNEKPESVRLMITDMETRVGGFVRGQVLLAVAIGVMAFVAYFFIGLPSIISLAFLAGVFELVPVFGPALGALPALLVDFGSSPSKIIWVLLVTILIQLLENHLLAPRVMQKTVGVNPIVTILSIIGFGSLFGFPGLLMAIPLAAVFQVILDRSILRPVESEIKAPMGRDRLSKLSYELQEFVQDIRKLVRRKEAGVLDENGDEIEDAIESIATDLEGILEQNIQPDNSP